MIFALLILVLVLAVALVQSTHGFFSALIMAVLTICCAATAVGSYEWVAVNWIAPMWKPGYAAPIALVLLFSIPLGLLRLAVDKLVPRSLLLPSWLDRGGGGVCGVVTALSVSGILAMSLQLIPFHNGSILGYARVPIHARTKVDDGPNPKPPKPDAEESELWLKPDRFAVALAGYLSDGVLSDTRSFLGDNPDWIQAAGWVNAAPAVATRYAPPNSIAVVRTEPIQLVYHYSRPVRKDDPPTFEPISPKSGHTFQMVRVKLKREARMDAKSHVFTLRQFRLVGATVGFDGAAGPRQQYHPVAIQQAKEATPNRHIKMQRIGSYGDWPVSEFAYMPRSGNNAEVEVVFELPEDFQPDYIEYKRAARARVSFGDGEHGSGEEDASASSASGASRGSGGLTAAGGPPASPVAETGTSRSTRGGRRRGSGRGGNVRGVTAGSKTSHFGAAMPVKLKAYTPRAGLDVARGRFVGGHLVAYVDAQDRGTKAELSTFEVPSDKRLLHLSTDQLQARSGIGKILSQTVQTLQNYFVTDERGRRYKVVGKYAVADVDGRRVWEIQYFSDPTGSIGGLGKFDKIQSRHLTGDYQFSLLFLVDPGAKIVSFSTGGSATRRDDLESRNLIAPK